MSRFKIFLVFVSGCLLGWMGSEFYTFIVNNVTSKLTGSDNRQRFASFVSAYSSGYVLSGTTPVLRFALEVNPQIRDEMVQNPNEFLEYPSSVTFSVQWQDERTLRLVHEKPFENGKEYNVEVKLDKIFPNNRDVPGDFEWKWKVVEKNLFVVPGILFSSEEKNTFDYSGTLYSSDYISQQECEQLFELPERLPVSWNHSADGKTHQFTIYNIKAKSPESAWNFKVKKWGNSGDQVISVSVPAADSFKLHSWFIPSDRDDPVLCLIFSQPVSENMPVESWIAPERKDMKCHYAVQKNVVNVYPESPYEREFNLNIFNGLKSIYGQLLNKDIKLNITWPDPRPQVEFAQEGQIIPSAGEKDPLLIPFKATNLKAVEVSVFKIFQNNLIQFFIQNNWEGSNNLHYLGQLVSKKVIPLSIQSPVDYKGSTTHYLNIRDLVQTEPGCMYRIILRIRKEWVACDCMDNKENSLEANQSIYSDMDDPSFYGYYSDYSYAEYESEDEYNYDWSKSNDPCNSAYYYPYSNKNIAAKNFIVSNLGLIVKKTPGKQYWAFVNNIQSSEPVKDAEVEAYSIQHQLLGRYKTDRNGMVRFQTTEPVAVVMASKDKFRTFLRMDESDLSTTMFDVEGEIVKKGARIFIYGERGVWRPGDTLFLSVMTHAADKEYFKNLPVKMELLSPEGVSRIQLVQNYSDAELYSFPVVLPPESKTGIWTVRVQAGPVSKQKSIRIETIVPNRIKIFSKTDQDHWLDLAVQHTLSVQANWLTGNKASHLEFDADLKISSYDALAQRYKNFCFQDMTITQPQYSFALNKGVLNEEGYGEDPFRINLNERVSGMVKCAFTIRVWEGGGFSSDVFSIVGSPYSSYVGFMLPENQEAGYYEYLECGKKHTVKVMNVQPDGNPIRSGKVEMEVYKLNWKWWWEKTYEGDAEYHSESFMQKILTQTLTTGQSGEGNFTLSFSNDEWGRYVIRMKDLNSGHIAAREVYVDWNDWMSRYNQQSEKSEILVIKSDKEKYKPGDRARINIPVPNHNRVLITLENSTGVLSSEWVESKKGSADYEFEIKPEMFPNIYVCAMAVQSANNYNAYPVRLYGITRINVEDPDVILNPVIDMPDVLRPGQKVNVRLSEKNGKPMNLTLAIVDEGLLDLTKFKTPNPLSYFAESEGYNNRTWDVFSKILRKDLNVDFQRILSVGGDAEFSDAEGAVKRFKPMVRFVGPVYVGKGEKKNLQIQLPPYIGSVRTMVVARSEHAFGSTEKTTPVRSDLMLSGQPPRFSASGDEWMLPVWVFSGSKPMKQIKLKAFAAGSGKTESSNEQIISLEKESQTLVYFKIKSSGEGMLNVKVTAECGSEKAEWTAEVPVILPTPVERKIEKFELKEGKNYNKVFAFTGSSSQNTVEANWSGMASIPFSWLYKSSAEYAYTCGEQIISNALTQLLIRDILFADNVNEKEKINKNVMHVLQQLKFYQINKGGISYWPNSEKADDWLTSYALFFIRKCEEKSISVPGGLKNKIMQYLKDQAEAWKPEKSMSSCQYYLQAYRLWALSFYRQAGLVLMNRLAGQVAPDRYSTMLLAMAYFNSGFSSAGDAVVKKYGNSLRKNSSLENCYYGRIHDLSVELLYQIQKNRLSDGKKVFDEVARYLQPDQWLSTRETALGLNACVEYLKKAGFDNRLQFKGKWNNQQLLVNTARSSYVQKEVIRKGQQVKFELFNQGKSAIFGQVIQYFKSEPEKETASENGFMIRQNLFYANGVPVEEERLKTGDKINLVVSVTYTGSVSYLEHVVAEIPLPAGWEWMNTWQDENNRVQLPGTDYVDIRDNKVIVYFSATAGININFSLPVSVSYPGRFYFPYPRVVATDKPEFYSYGKGRYVNVNISSSEGTAMR